MKVFISSVISGYEEPRAAAQSAVTALNHIPVRAEDFPASTQSPRVACLQGVRESEVYLGLLGAHFSEPTAEEYEEAVRLGKIILVFVERTEREPDQKEFVARVEDYVAGHFRASFSDKDQLFREIVRALATATRAAPQFDVSDQRIAELSASTVRRGQAQPSILQQFLVPAISERLLSAQKMERPQFEERLLESPFSRPGRIFDRRLATNVRHQGDQIVVFQNAPSGAGEEVRQLTTDAFGTLVFSLQVDSAADYREPFRAFYVDPEVVRSAVQQFLAFSSRYFEEIDPTAIVAGFSFAAGIWGTDKHFETPPDRISTMSMPWSTGGRADPIIVPQQPMHLSRDQLKGAERLANEFVALLRQQFRR